jgi:hypothetical protein
MPNSLRFLVSELLASFVKATAAFIYSFFLPRNVSSERTLKTILFVILQRIRVI